MRIILWVLLVAALLSLALWIVAGPWYPKTPLTAAFVFAYFLAPNVGAIWMMYVAIRYEQHPLAFVLLAFVSFSFLWYYFERVRRGEHLTKRAAIVA